MIDDGILLSRRRNKTMSFNNKDDDDEGLSVRSGQQFEPMRHYGRSHQLDSTEQKHKAEVTRVQKLGINHEKKFVAFTKKLIESGRLPHHIKKVRKASEIEDKRHKIDAKVRVCYWFAPEHDIKIQIKTSTGGAQIFREENPEILGDIHIMIVNDETTLEHIRVELKNILRREKRRLLALRRSVASQPIQQQLST